NAPLMIVKGDGSLMTEKIAKERPIETILSGPAASIIGATYLNDIENGLVVDMGGTTTDVAILADGRPLVTKEGADVGGWRTRVSAVNAYTFGLGGDSYFSQNTENGRWEVGPRRSRPISIIAKEYPYYKQELYERRHRPAGLFGFGQADGLILLHEPEEGVPLSDAQKKLIEALKNGPHTLVELGKRTGFNANLFYPERLIHLGILGIVGFTPSDVLCARGLYDVGDREAAEVAAELIADSRGMELEDFYNDCIAKVEEKMGRSLLTCVLERSGLKAEHFDDAAEFYFRHGFGLSKSDFLDVGFRIGTPIIGIGAPIHAWLKEPSRKLGVEPIISKNHEVANAVGAAAGKVMNIYSLVVENVGGEYLSVFAPWGKKDYFRNADDPEEAGKTLDEIVPYVVEDAVEEARQRLCDEMREQGISHYEILVERQDSSFSFSNDQNIKVFLESKIDVIAVGLPSWAEESKESKEYLGKGGVNL
ncbi:MAG: hypothetical protein IJC82_07505, partial [Firmicutes bacterium]|nr:hypothetical protein [Bacillota bacterium]